MILEQYYLGCLSQASYLIGDPEAGVAAVVDPRRDVQLYLDEAKARGVEIRWVLLTHFHADFVAGHLELRERTGAEILLGAAASADYPFRPLADGDVLEVGSVRVRALATPGHTPESTCYLVHEPGEEVPHAILTGDTLFIGDVGRPDLMASVGFTAEELAGKLYDSLRTKILPLADATLVYPGHGAGSACGKNLSTDTVSTVGDQRRLNYALQDMERDAFIEMVTANQPPAPRYFPHDAVMNRRERPTLDQALSALRPMSLAEVNAAVNAGAQLVDVRDAAEFARGHVAGSVNVGLDGRFASWAGTVLDLERPILLVAPPGEEQEAALRLGRVGLDTVQGFLADAEGAFEGTSTRIDVATLTAELGSDAPPVVLDVRQPGEHAAGAIEEALHVPLGEVEERLDEIPRGRPVVVHCASGYRSMTAMSLLRRAGYTNVRDLEGGIQAWEAAGGAVVATAGSCSA